MLGFAAIAFLSLASPAYAQSNGQSPARSVVRRIPTVLDTIAMQRLVGQGLGLHDFLAWSPDHEHFVTITERGDLARNARVFSLLLFSTKRIFEATPERLTEFHSSQNEDGIADLRWLDNRTLTFLGTEQDEPTQVYLLDILSKELTRLTAHPTKVNAYAIATNLKRLIFTADADLASDDQRARAHGLVVIDQSLADILMGHFDSNRLAWRELDYEEPQITYVEQLDNTRVIALRTTGGLVVAVPNALFPYSNNAISPDGHLAIIKGYVPGRDKWRAFPNAFPSTIPDRGLVSTFVLVDLESGTGSLLLDAPASPYLASVVWRSDSQSAVVVNSFLPLDRKEMEPTRRPLSTSVAEVNIKTRQVTPIVGPALSGATGQGVVCAQALEWQGPTDRVVFAVSTGRPDNEAGVCNPNMVAIYKKTSTGWRQVAVYDGSSYLRSTPDGRVTISIDQSLNVPPNLRATERKTGRAKLLTDLNPQLEALTLADVTIVRWAARDKTDWSADLYLPPAAKPPSGYPLVIQTHGCTTDKFDVNGLGLDGATGFAAQPLAGAGIAVLQMGHCANARVESHFPYYTARNAEHELLGYESAIDLLADKGLIDRTRVGLQGHSATSWIAIYAAANPKEAYEYRAILSTARNDLGYFSYLATEYGHLWSDQGNGGAPVGSNFEGFRRHALPFNLERVATPILSQEPDGLRYLPLMWEIHQNLRMLGRPEELIVFPNGTHNLVRPWERLTSQEAAVDWFRFWLQGIEGSDPAKAEQYQRWERLCDLQRTADSDKPAFCVGTKH